MSTRSPEPAGLPRAARLRQRAEFVATLAAGAAATRRHFVLFARSNGERQARVGIIAGKKALPRAIDRNRAKRLVRESFREFRHRLGGLDIVVQVRRCPPRGATAAARAELERLLAGLVPPVTALRDPGGN